MSQITLKNVSGNDTGTVDLDDSMFGIEPNVPVMHQVVTAQLAARRAGTQSTKTRSEVRGGGAKPYRQKGTGNARQGSIRSPQFNGGGVALGPKPRNYGQKTPKKMIGLALRSALSDRANDGKIVVVDSWGWDTPSTKTAKAALADLGITGKALVVVARDDAVTSLSFRNLPEIQLITPDELNAYDVLCNEVIVFTQDTLPAAPQAASGIEARVEAAASAVSAAAEKVSEKAESALESVADAAESAAGKVAEAAEGAVEKITDLVEDLTSDGDDDEEEGQES